MRALQKAYIAVLNPIFEYGTSRIDERIRDGIVSICIFIMTVYYPLLYSGVIPKILKNDTEQCIFGSLIVGIIIIFSIKDKLKPVPWNKKFCVIYFLSGLGIFLAGCMHPIGNGYRPFSMIMMVGFPCLYFVWNNRKDYKTLYDKFAGAACIIGFIYLLFCLIFFPIDANSLYGRYQGSTTNPNYIGMFGTMLINASIYFFLQKTKGKLIFAVTAAGGAVFLVLSMSRTSTICAVLSIVLWGAFLLKRFFENKSLSPAKKRLLLCIVIFMILLALLLCILVTVSVVEKQTQSDGGILGSLLDRFSMKDGRDLNAFSSGRISLWKSFLTDLNLTGHDYSLVKPGTPGNIELLHAHNCFLEFAHRCGIPTGLLYLLMETMALLYALKRFFNGKNEAGAYMAFPALFISTFYVSSMIEIQVLPFNRIFVFYFFMSLIPVFEERVILSHSKGRKERYYRNYETANREFPSDDRMTRRHRRSRRRKNVKRRR